MRVSFNSVAGIYDETRGPPQHVMSQLIRKIVQELSSYKTVLDVGVGTGRFAKPIQDNGFEVVGIDISKRMIEKAIEKSVDNILLGDACYLPFKDDSFDAAICIHILHLIKDWKMALQEICRVTRKIMATIMYVKENPIRETYDSLLKGYGYESRRLGKGEWELKDLITPSKSVFVGSFESRADERLAYLSQRAYSNQWEIPEEINRKVVDELKRRFGGKVFPQELRLLVWDINDLKAYCKGERRS